MGAIYGHSKTGWAWDVKATHSFALMTNYVMFMQVKHKVIRLVLERNYISLQLTFSLWLFTKVAPLPNSMTSSFVHVDRTALHL